MSLQRWRLDQLRPHNLRPVSVGGFNRRASVQAYVANAVCHKNGRCCTALFRCTGHVGHANADDKADDWSEEPYQSVTNNRCSGLMCPGASPDHSTPSDDRNTAENQKDEPDIGYSAGKISSSKDEEEANAAQGELKEYGVQRGPSIMTVSCVAIPIRMSRYPKVETINGPKPDTAPFTVYLERWI